MTDSWIVIAAGAALVAIVLLVLRRLIIKAAESGIERSAADETPVASEIVDQQAAAEQQPAPANASADDDLAFLEAGVSDADLAAELEAEEKAVFLSGTDDVANKLDLALAYIEMGDGKGAREMLDEVLRDGNAAQIEDARRLLNKL